MPKEICEIKNVIIKMLIKHYISNNRALLKFIIVIEYFKKKGYTFLFTSNYYVLALVFYKMLILN